MRYSKKNIEDWDFRECYMGSPNYDAEADLFFSGNFFTAVAVDAVRLSVIGAFIDSGKAKVEPDRQHVGFEGNGDAYLGGWRSGVIRLTSSGRFERKVVQALRLENKKYGRLRVTILPPLPGFSSDQGSDLANGQYRRVTQPSESVAQRDDG